MCSNGWDPDLLIIVCEIVLQTWFVMAFRFGNRAAAGAVIIMLHYLGYLQNNDLKSAL